MNRFINLLLSNTIDVYKNRTVNRTEAKGNRTTKRICIQTGIDRCAIRQEEHRGNRSNCKQSVLRQLHEEEASRKLAEGTSREGQAEGTGTTRLILPSFLFSYNAMLILQSIDDICMHVNPILWSMII